MAKEFIGTIEEVMEISKDSKINLTIEDLKNDSRLIVDDNYIFTTAEYLDGVLKDYNI